MPSPQSLEEYRQVQPDLPERMMRMAEYSQKSRVRHQNKILELKQKDIETDNTVISAESLNQKLSLLAAFIVVLICLTASVYLAKIGKDTLAAIIGGTTVVGIVASFLTRNRAFKQKADSSIEE